MANPTSKPLPLPTATDVLVLVTDWAELRTGDRVILQHNTWESGSGTVDAITFDRRIFWFLPDGILPRRMIHVEDGYEIIKFDL